MFNTRIPCPSCLDHAPEYLEKSTWYFPLVGLIVDGLSALVFYLNELAFSNELAIIFSVRCSVLITGAFHEGGLHDACDGLGGVWTKEKILETIKDSGIGTYGAVGLVLAQLSKFLLSVELANLSVKYFVFFLGLCRFFESLQREQCHFTIRTF